jgi:hypothetical protein
MSAYVKIVLLLGGAILAMPTVWFLVAMFCREAVKRDLQRRFCEPIRVSWVPWAFWARYGTISFRVVYRDSDGIQHQARCFVYQDLMGSAFGPRLVKWTRDEIKPD